MRTAALGDKMGLFAQRLRRRWPARTGAGMKRVVFTMAMLTALAAFAPVSAQTYDPRYPVCMHVYGERIGDRIDCIFTSIAQCQATASGLPAKLIADTVDATPGVAMRNTLPLKSAT